jgi:tetratricopeptide (TPR) repeat protein
VLTKSPDDPYALAGLAKASLLLGNDAEGIDYAKQYLDLSRKSQVNWHKQLKEWEKIAGKEITRDQRGFYVEKIQGAREKEKGVLLLLGTVYMRREQYNDAVDAYDQVIKLDPALSPAYVERAQAYARLNQYELAVKDLEEYLKITDPVKQRNARASAAELLDRYQRISGTAPVLVPANTPATPPFPSHPPR